MKMHSKMSSAKWQPFCPRADELTCLQCIQVAWCAQLLRNACGWVNALLTSVDQSLSWIFFSRGKFWTDLILIFVSYQRSPLVWLLWTINYHGCGQREFESNRWLPGLFASYVEFQSESKFVFKLPNVLPLAFGVCRPRLMCMLVYESFIMEFEVVFGKCAPDDFMTDIQVLSMCQYMHMSTNVKRPCMLYVSVIYDIYMYI